MIFLKINNKVGEKGDHGMIDLVTSEDVMLGPTFTIKHFP